MSEIGKILQMIKEKNAAVSKLTTDIIESFGEKLVKAYGITFDQEDIKITWGEIRQLGGNPDILVIPGKIEMNVGDIIEVENGKVTITEENIEEYSETASLMFPVIMLEVATPEELSKYMTAIFEEGGKDEDDSKLVEFVKQQGIKFEEALLEDSDRLEALTKERFIGGFDTEGLTENQIRQLRWYTENPLHTMN